MNIITDASLPAHVFVAGRAVVAHYDYLHRGEGAWYRVRVESERDTAWDCADPDTDTDSATCVTEKGESTLCFRPHSFGQLWRDVFGCEFTITFVKR